MQNLKLKYDVTELQQLFVEKTLEVLHKDTIDTYRLRLHNPTSLLRELVKVCLDLKLERLRNHDYATTLIREMARILQTDHNLNFDRIELGYFNKLLTEAKGKKVNYSKVIHSANLLLSDNMDYFNKLHEKLRLALIAENRQTDLSLQEAKDFNLTVQYYYIELTELGYSRFYLDHFANAVLIGLSRQSFEERFEILHSLYDRPHEEFTVVFGLTSYKINLVNVRLRGTIATRVTARDKAQLRHSTNQHISSYLDKHNEELLLITKVTCSDYYRALELGKELMLEFLDSLYVSYSKSSITLMDEIAVIGANDPTKSRVYNSTYRIEGHFEGRESRYLHLSESFDFIKNNERISEDTVNKLISGIRNLRLGTEATDLGNKLLNYWIGLEFIFAIFDADEYTISRIRTYLPRCHALIYLRRNLFSFHRDLERLGLHEGLSNYDGSLAYLLHQETHDIIQSNTKSILAKYRSRHIWELINDSKQLQSALINHQENLDWNIMRIYRIRNEIVHNAAIRSDIVTLVSHLRSYLTFIINNAVDFLLNERTDVNSDGQVSIEDFFILQDIRLSSIETNKERMSVESLLKLRVPRKVV
ncbi:hypothetical protein [Neolewinella sp.]|uniref:hypothetical protein n=1 Tax=Neolewinella sp. TaxID=2993543 RepID=UPI003B5298CD